jgi:hypothetical protein
MPKRRRAECSPACTRQLHGQIRDTTNKQETGNATKRSGFRRTLVGVRYVTAPDYCGVLLFSLFDRGVIRLPSASGVH